MSIVGNKRNANSISCLIVFMIGMLFLTACFSDYSEMEISIEKKQPKAKEGLTGKIKNKRLSENPFLKASSPETDFLSEKTKINNNYGKLPIKFEVNQGQFDSHVKFTSRGKD